MGSIDGYVFTTLAKLRCHSAGRGNKYMLVYVHSYDIYKPSNRAGKSFTNVNIY